MVRLLVYYASAFLLNVALMGALLATFAAGTVYWEHPHTRPWSGWALAAAFGSFVAIWWGRDKLVDTARERRRRREQGLCLSCGYDLTGNASRTCAECGTPMAEGADPPAARCSFCGRPRDRAGPMIERPGDLYICISCIHAAAAIPDETEQGACPAPSAEPGGSRAVAGRASPGGPERL